MPEALATVPPLQMPSENSSEMGSSSTPADITDGSANSPNLNGVDRVGACKQKLCVKSQAKRQLRKSIGRRNQKKPPLRPLASEKKLAVALKLKSHIPRAVLLTSASSTTSLATNDSLPSPLLPIEKIPTASEEDRLEATASGRSLLVRHNTAVILAFRQRKSLSQMDFSRVRRQVNFPRNKNESDSALLPSNFKDNAAMAYANNSFVHKMFDQDYCCAMPIHDPQMAGMKIFATIMLNAWRKRRDEVRRLLNEVADLKRGAIKAKNQIHVFSSLFRVEQKRNDELNCQLKSSLENINITKSSCESLTSSIISLKADKALLEQQLLIKEQEFESVNAFLNQTKSELFKSMTVQRQLQAALSTEQRHVQKLENQKNQLINEICELNSDAMQKEHGLREEVKEKYEELSRMKTQLSAAENQIRMLKESAQLQSSESKQKEQCMRQEIEALENELKVVRHCLEHTFGNRLQNCWSNSVTYQKITLQMLHWLVYYLLPATPPPKWNALPFRVSLDKALRIVKR